MVKKCFSKVVLILVFLLAVLSCEMTPLESSLFFITNGGARVDTLNIENGKAAVKPTDPVKEGYTFTGWHSNAGCTTDWDFSSIITCDTVLFAEWTTNSYAITYELDGGTNHTDNPLSYTIESHEITLQNPSYSGNTFYGWYAEDSYDTEVFTIAAGSTGNKTMYANWSEIYTITYELDGGTNHADNPIKYTANVETFTLNNPTRRGYNFLGWYSDGSYAAAVTEIPTGSSGDKTLSAKWEIITSAITYELYGGVNSSSNPAAFTIESTEIELKEPTRTDTTFLGWYEESGYETSVTTIPAGSLGAITLHAKWWETAPEEDFIFEYSRSRDRDVPSELMIRAYIGDDAHVIIPDTYDGDTIKIIGPGAFSGSNIVQVVIPDTVHAIQEAAFAECYDLKQVTFGAGLKSIESEAFAANESLTAMVIPDSVKTLGDEVFAFCSNLETVVLGSSLSSMGYGVFYECESLTEVTFSSTIDEIPEESFYSCSNLVEIVIPDSVFEIGNRAFSHCESLEKVTFGAGVSEIRERAFAYCTSLSEIVFPDSVTYLANEVFSNCAGLTSVTIPVTLLNMKNQVFANCDNLTDIYCDVTEQLDDWDDAWNEGNSAEVHWASTPPSSFDYEVIGGNRVELIKFTGSETKIVIPDAIHGVPVTKIRSGLFEGMDTLTSVVVGSNVEIIESSAFKGCTALTNVELPDSLTSLGDYLFSGCTSLTGIVIKGRVTEIGESAFDGCTSLTSFSLPDTVTRIGANAFKSCSSLESIPISDYITAIGETSFKGCSSAESLSIGAGLATIGLAAFDGLTSMETITVDAANAHFMVDSGVLFDTGKSEIIIYPAGKSENYFEIPTTVTTIPSGTFANSALTRIFIPGTVTTVGSSLFSGSSNLAVIYVESASNPAGWDTAWDSGCSATVEFGYVLTPVSNIDYSTAELVLYDDWEPTFTGTYFVTFDGVKSAVEDVVIPVTIDGLPVLKLGHSVFMDDTTLESVKLPYGITAIPTYGFRSCSNLNSINFPNTITSIAWKEAFYRCESLMVIDLPDSLTYLGESTFSGCSNLASVKLGKGLKEIGASAFSYISITSIIIPESVEIVGTWAFAGARSLANIYCKASDQTSGWDANWKYNCSAAEHWGWSE